ncbi:hypothetical protein [Pontibacillus salipaludis]|uniref:hypothetical protein n=1 Tax=Pontibacillus salipaludis TaxID=1697394 RepID=UPI0031E6AD79
MKKKIKKAKSDKKKKKEIKKALKKVSDKIPEKYKLSNTILPCILHKKHKRNKKTHSFFKKECVVLLPFV